jgi:hypothetical protein
MTPTPAANSHPIRAFHADEIGADVARFYELYAHEPLIMRGVFQPGHPVRNLSLERIEALLGDSPIQVYDTTTQGYLEVPTAEIFTGISRGVTRYNVVDHYIVGTPLGELFETPPFLRCNWCLGYPAHFDRLEKSLVLSPRGSFTPLHLEAYGM